VPHELTRAASRLLHARQVVEPLSSRITYGNAHPLRVSTDVNRTPLPYSCESEERGFNMASEEYAVVIMTGGGPPQIWPTRGRSKESFEAFCATCGAMVFRAYPNMEEAAGAVDVMVEGGFTE
jgi:hypothetical protein